MVSEVKKSRFRRHWIIITVMGLVLLFIILVIAYFIFLNKPVANSNKSEIATQDNAIPKLVCDENMTRQGKCVVDNSKVRIKLNSIDITDAIVQDETTGIASITDYLRANGEISATAEVGVINGQFYVYDSTSIGVSAAVGRELNLQKTTDYTFSYPKEGNHFIIVDLTIENLNYQEEYLYKGESPEEQNTLYIYATELQLSDNEDYSYEPTSVISDVKNLIPWNIYVSKGDKLRGKMVYEVPISAQITEFSLKGGSSSGKRDIGTLKLDISDLYSIVKSKFANLTDKLTQSQKSGFNNSSNDNSIDKATKDLINAPREIVIIQNPDGTFTCPNKTIVKNSNNC